MAYGRPNRLTRVWGVALAVVVSLTACSAGVTASPESSAPAASTTAVTTSTGTVPAATGSCPAAAELSLRDRLKQTVMVFAAVGASPLPAWYREIGGVLIDGRSFRPALDGRFARLASAPIPPMVAVDEEGGRVQRIDDIAGPMPSPRVQAATMTPAEVKAMARKRGEALRRIGATIDFAPVVDLDDGPADGIVGDRSYSSDPRTVTTYAGAFAAGLHDAGLIATLKHFPGHGRAVGDSHAVLPTAPPLTSLATADLLPYRALLARPGPWAVMVGHLSVPGLTRGRTPTSLTPATYAYLRQRVGFQGLAVTDELTGMRAVSGSFTTADAVRLALSAGADLALLARVGSITELLDTLEADVADGSLSEARVTEAADRVLALKTCGRS